jgi:hypothetical protein
VASGAADEGDPGATCESTDDDAAGEALCGDWGRAPAPAHAASAMHAAAAIERAAFKSGRSS